MITDQEILNRLAVLDARDKQLRQQMTKQTEFSKAQAYEGTCEDMCPERERIFRIGFQTSIFERDQDNQPDEFLMVTEYRRPGADQEEPLPHDLRTLSALKRTMDYLVRNVMDDPRSTQPGLTLEWYDFLWDRLRAIRKEITQQKMCDLVSARLIQQCTRFHIHSSYAMNRIKGFDVKMNQANLNDCLQMLRKIYIDLRYTGLICPDEFEFQKYAILLHLNDQIETNILMKTFNHSSNMDIKFVLNIINAHANNDFYRFFKLMEQADYITSCILSLYVNEIRLNSFKIIVTATCTSKKPVWYPVDILINMLGFDDLGELSSFASLLALEIKEKDHKSYILLSKDLLTSIKPTDIKKLPPIKSHRLIESKKSNQSVGQIIYGSEECQPDDRRDDDVMTSMEAENEGSFTEEVVAGPGSEPTLGVVAKANSQAQVTWFKDGPPLIDRQLRDGHLEPSVGRADSSAPNETKYVLKVDGLRAADAATYHVKAENPLGSCESAPIELKLDRGMRPSEQPQVSRRASQVPSQAAEIAPAIVASPGAAPGEVVAAPGSSPALEVAPKAEPEAKVQWFKDGQTIPARLIRDGHVEMRDESTLQAGVTEHSLEVNDSRPSDAAAHHRREACFSMPVGKKRVKRTAKPVSQMEPLQAVYDAAPTRATRSKGLNDVIKNLRDQIEYERDANQHMWKLLRMLM